MLKDTLLYLERARCYGVVFRIKQYETYMKHDPSTVQGQKFHDLLENDPTLKMAQFPRADYSNERKAIEEYLSNPRFKPIWERYNNARKNKQKGEWYFLCSKARNVRELAKEIGREAEYAMMYQHLSELVHGTDVITGALRYESEKGPSIHQIRGPVTKINMVASYTTISRSHNLMLRTFFADDPAFITLYVQWLLTFRP
jgi:hypothetical protein